MPNQFSAYHMVLAMALNHALKQFDELEERRRTGRIADSDDVADGWGPFHPFFSKYQAASVSTVLLAAATVEAYANFVISAKVDPGTFETLERTKLLQKWVHVIPLLESGYVIDPGGQLYEGLVLLIKRRNQILHPKPEMKLDTGIVHKGNPPIVHPDEPGFVRKSASLPGRLLESLCLAGSDEASTLLVSSGLPISEVVRIQKSMQSSD